MLPVWFLSVLASAPAQMARAASDAGPASRLSPTFTIADDPMAAPLPARRARPFAGAGGQVHRSQAKRRRMARRVNQRVQRAH